MPVICPECGSENSSKSARCRVCNEQLKRTSHRKKKKRVATVILVLQIVLLVTSFLPVLFSVGEYDAVAPEKVNVFFSSDILYIPNSYTVVLVALATVLSIAASVGIYIVAISGKHIRRKFKFFTFAPVLGLLFSAILIIVANSSVDALASTSLATVNITYLGILWIFLHVVSCILTYVYSKIK